MDNKLKYLQRLWIIATILFAIPLAINASREWPDESYYSNMRVYDSILAAGKYLEKASPGYVYKGARALREEAYKGFTDQMIVEDLHTKFKGAVDFAPIDARYQEGLETLKQERLEVVGFHILLWVIPSVSVYVVLFVALKLMRRNKDK